MALPLKPPIKPQLAKSSKDLPEGEEWRYEPKWDGFRTLAFRDGDDVHLQSRNGRPMNRYFPEVVEQVAAMGAKRFVLDGEIVIVVDGVQEFDLLSQRIHPAASRVERLANETPAAFVAFDLLAEGGKKLLELPYDKRRAQLEKIVEKPVQLTPVTDNLKAAGKWLTGTSEGVIAKQGAAPYLPGERKGMVKIKRVRTAECVVAAFRFGKEEGTVGSLILGMYDGKELHIVGHTSGFTAKQKRELLELLEPYRTRRARLGRAQPLEERRGARVGGSPPRAGVRGGLRPHHRQPDTPRGQVPALARRQGGGRVRHRAAAFLIGGSRPAGPAARRGAQPGVSYLIPPDNPFVGAATASREIWALGFRNPYRFSFDSANGEHRARRRRQRAADRARGGQRHPRRPGGPELRLAMPRGDRPGPQVCTAPGAVDPVYTYPTGGGAAITGGYVVRDAAGLPDLNGRYLFATTPRRDHGDRARPATPTTRRPA